jgi:hypothetical protein
MAASATREGSIMRTVYLTFGATLVAAALWAGWWFIGSAAKETAFADWLADRRAEGWQAEAASIETQGFPSRFDTRIERLALADPEAGWSWTTPFLDVLMLSYRPNAAVIALPSGQTLAAPGARATLDADRLRGSLRFQPDASLPVERLSIEADRPILTGDTGWVASAHGLAAHLRESNPETAPENGYDFHVEANAVRLPDPVRALIDPAGALPAVFDRFLVDARAAFDAPLDRYAVEDAFPGARAISLKALEARWGKLALRATGALRADAQGYAEGELTVRAENWRDMLRAAVDAGALPAELAGPLEFGLQLLAGLGGGDDIEAPLIFSEGRIRLGPITIGRAPRIARPAASG